MAHTNAKVLGRGLEERVLRCLLGFAGAEWGGSGLLAGSCFGFGGLVIETRLATSILKMQASVPRSSSASVLRQAQH